MKQKSEEREVSEMDIRAERTSVIINTIYDLFKNTTYGRLPFRGTSLVTNKDRDGHDIVSVNLVFAQGAANA